jgi:signal transduction histidine kinase
LFFLGALALVLAGSSATLYLLAQSYLHRQADERLELALETLTVATEVSPEGVEWDPHDRRVSLGSEDGAGLVWWRVSDERGKWVDGSPTPAAREVLARATHLKAGAELPLIVDAHGQPWLVGRRRLGRGPRAQPTSGAVERPVAGEGERKYDSLVLTVGVALGPVYAELRSLAGALAGVSVGVWLLACFAGRALCRRALRPVARMARAARAMGADPGQRLPASNQADELADLGQAFNGLLQRLQESFERQQRFTGDASHQLRTPLTAMLGQTEVALRRARSPEEYQRALASVQSEALRLRRIMEALLFLARADAEALLPDLERIHLPRWVADHLTAGPQRPRAADLRLECPPDGPGWVEAQGPLLGQLVDLLVDNACKYSEPGTPVTLRAAGGSGSVLLTVEDRGWGIAAPDLPHIFEPFYRSAEAQRRGRGGFGLGLAIAQRIAGALGGDLTAESEPGQGSRFTLRLSATDPASAAGP